MMRLLVTLLACIPLALTAQDPPKAAEQDLPEEGLTDEAEGVALPAGSQRVLAVTGVTRAAIGDPSLADVQVVSPDELLITGVRAGRTNLTLWYGERFEQRTVVVSESADLREAQGTLEVLGLAHLQVRNAAGRMVLTGTVDSYEQWERLGHFREVFPDAALLVRTAPGLHDRIAERITEALHEAGLVNARARAVGQTIFLEGVVDDESDLRKAAVIAEGLYGEVDTRLDGP